LVQDEFTDNGNFPFQCHLREAHWLRPVFLKESTSDR
jgi:hypothetical protein